MSWAKGVPPTVRSQVAVLSPWRFFSPEAAGGYRRDVNAMARLERAPHGSSAGVAVMARLERALHGSSHSCTDKAAAEFALFSA
jgi:hypothetical protein